MDFILQSIYTVYLKNIIIISTSKSVNNSPLHKISCLIQKFKEPYFPYLKHHSTYKHQSTARITFVCNYSAKSNLNKFFNVLAHSPFTVTISAMSQIGYIFPVIKRHIKLELFSGGALITENMALVVSRVS